MSNVSDKLMIGFDKSGDDKASLTVIRRKGRGYEVVKQFIDGDAEYLYEQLSDNRVMSKSRNITDFIDRLIEDMTDSIDDYRGSRSNAFSKTLQRNYSVRIDELIDWINSLRKLRKEYEE